MKAFNLSDSAVVYFYDDAVSMAYGIPGLSVIVEKKLKTSPENGNLFFFHNKNGTYVKILYFDGTGMCIWLKKLSKGQFEFDGVKKKFYVNDIERVVNTFVGQRRAPAKFPVRRSSAAGGAAAAAA